MGCILNLHFQDFKHALFCKSCRSCLFYIVIYLIFVITYD